MSVARATRASVPSARAISSMRASSPADSALIVFTPRLGELQLLAVLPTPVKAIAAGVNPARRATSITAGVRVGCAAEIAQQARDRERRGGLQRVVERMRIASEGGVYRSVAVWSPRRCRRNMACRRS